MQYICSLNIKKNPFVKEKSKIDPETRVLVKIGPHFIEERKIRSMGRSGKGILITLTSGEELKAEVDYDKACAMLKIDL